MRRFVAALCTRDQRRGRGAWVAKRRVESRSSRRRGSTEVVELQLGHVMPLPVTTAADLDRHLAALGLSQQHNVVVHSRLISFGRVEGGTATVYESLRRAVGAEGTIAVPTYTLDLAADQPYDPLTSSSMKAGVLGEYVRRLPGAARSRCPLHNHSAIGPAASLIARGAGDQSVGQGSDFDVFRRAGFSLLLLGCGFDEGATFIHHVEALVGVPYREWVHLPRTIVVEGASRSMSVRYYSRASNIWIEDFDKVRAAMEASGVLRVVDCPFGRSYLVPLAVLEAFVSSMLHVDPYAVVRAADGVGSG
jgi:aminoglycoside N3'-acetyltransferase